MKKALTILAVALSVGLTAFDAEAARRLGGGKSSGMQRESVTAPARSQPASPAPTTPQSQPATAGAAAPAAATAANAAAAPAKRSWLGPVAGLAAGLGLAALASHFGFAEELASFMLIGLLVLAVLVVVGLVMRRRAAGATPALAASGAGAGGGHAGSPLSMQRTAEPAGQRTGSLIGSGIGSGIGAPAPAGVIPADFDVAGFTRAAQANFTALQEANDARDLVRLREYLTPEMFEVVKADLADRGDAPQRTEVFGLAAQVLAVVEEGDRYVASVRFTGSIRHEAGAAPEDLDETWHLVKARNGAGGWVVAGIQQA